MPKFTLLVTVFFLLFGCSSSTQEINPNETRCQGIETAEAQAGKIYFVGTGCEHFSPDKTRCKLEATQNAQLSLVQGLGQKISSLCELAKRSHVTRENTFLESEMVCSSSFKASNIDISAIQPIKTICFEEKMSGEGGHRSTVFRYFVRLEYDLTAIS